MTTPDSPLELAAQCNILKLARNCLKPGSPVYIDADSKGTALIRASERGHNSLAQLLIDYGACVEFSKMEASALIVASQRGHVTTVRLLLDNGANINGRAKYGTTALIQACAGGY